MKLVIAFIVSICSFSSIFSQTKQSQLKPICILPDSIPESSGIIALNSNSFWTHSDGKNTSALFEIDSLGNLLRRIELTNGSNVDWEDLTIDDSGNFYIGDLGNNNSDRENLLIYKINNPSLHDSNTVWAELIKVNYADQNIIPSPIENRNFDVEGIAHYDGYVYLFTKNRAYPTSGYTKMYRVQDLPGEYTLNVLDSFYIETHIQLGRVTSADISSNGDIALLTNQQITILKNGPNGLGSGSKTYYRFNFTDKQLEAIEFIDSVNFYLTDEKPGNLYIGTILDERYEYPLQNKDIESVEIFTIQNNLLLIKNPLKQIVNIDIYSLNGQLIYQKQFSEFEYQIDLKSIECFTNCVIHIKSPEVQLSRLIPIYSK